MDSIIVFGAKYLFLVIPVAWFMVWLKLDKKNKKEFLVSTVLVVVLAVILDKIASKTYYDPRPFVADNIKPLVSHAADNGFPSEHTLFSTTLATLVIFYRRRLGLLLLVIAVLIGASRMAAHVHSLQDIVAGVLIGALSATMGVYLARKFLANQKLQPKPKQNE